jgi:hypothetical protein
LYQKLGGSDEAENGREIEESRLRENPEVSQRLEVADVKPTCISIWDGGQEE